MSSFGWVAGPGMPREYRDAAYTSRLHIEVDPDPDGDMDRPPELADLGRLARRGLRGVVRAARERERPVPSQAVREHLGTSPGDVVAETWASYEMVNVQRALDVWVSDPGRSHVLHGVHGFDESLDLAGLLSSADPDQARLGPVQRTNRSCGPDGQTLPCVTRALYLVTDEQGSYAIYVRQATPGDPRSAVEVTSADPDAGPRILTELKHLASEHNVFRRQVLSFGGDMFSGGDSVLAFHPRPSMTRADLVLDEDILAAIERQVVGVARHREALLAAGQHLKRGVLLYGPPGVGKTHTVRYLVSTLPDITVIQVSGDSLHLIAEACSAARSLAPSLVVVEDVDLIAEDRGMFPGQHPLLFQLLNEMDGIAGDVDVAFVLTTNRADLLEPALAARPGRIDEAVAIDLPDLDARRRLFDLYRGRLRLDAPEDRIDAALDRAQGVTASFLKELLRRTTLHAAERCSSEGAPARAADLVATADDLDAALDGLLATRSRMTRTLLGSGATAIPPADTPHEREDGIVGDAGWAPDLPGGGSDADEAGWES